MKKACAVLLCFALVMCLFPSGIFAAGKPPASPVDSGRQATVTTSPAPAASQTLMRAGQRTTGLKAPAARETALFKKTAKMAAKILPNRDGLARINESLRQKGLQPFSSSLAAADGEEIITGDGSSKSTQKYGSILGNYQLLRSALPAAVDLSLTKAFPAIGDQGNVGSCASFSTTYYAATYETALKRGIDLSAVPGRVLSPRFTYNLNNDGYDFGSSLIGNLLTLYTRGSPFTDEASMSAYQYNGYDYLSDGTINPLQYRAYPQTAAIYNDALKNRIADAGVVTDANTAEGLALIRQMINNGHVLVFGTGYIYDWQVGKRTADDPSTSADNAFVGQGACYGAVIANPDATSMHALTVVGYNDDLWVDIDGDAMVDAFEKGALKIANSWGPEWMNDGCIWLSYDALRDANGHSGVVMDNELYYIVAQDEYVPRATAEVTVTTDRRDELTLLFGVNWSEAGAPLNAYSDYVFSGHWGGAYSFAGTTDETTATVVLDLTDAIDLEGFNDDAGMLSLCAGVIDDTQDAHDQRVERVIYKTGGKTLPTINNVPKLLNADLRWFCGKTILNADNPLAVDPPAYDPTIEMLPVMKELSTYAAYSAGPDDVAEWVFTPEQSGYHIFKNSLYGRENGLEILNGARQPIYAGSTELRVPLYAGKTYVMRAYSATPGTGVSFTAEANVSESWSYSSASPRLSGLGVSGGTALSPAFSADVLNYGTIVTGGFTLTATPEDAGAYVVTGNKPGNSVAVAINENERVLTRVEVTAKDWLRTRVYRVNATRGAVSANADLASLTVDPDALKPAFADATDEYFVELPEDRDRVTITAGAVEAQATVVITGSGASSDSGGGTGGTGGSSGSASLTLSVQAGESTIVTVRVTAPDLVTTRTYLLHVNRPGRFTPRNFRIANGSFKPYDTLLTPDAGCLFLTDNVGRRLIAAELENGIKRSLTLTDTPMKMAFSEGKLLIALATPAKNADQVLIVNPTDLTIERTIPVALDMIGLAADRNYLYVYSETRIDVIDRATGAKTSALGASVVYDLQVNPVNGLLYGLVDYDLTTFDVVGGQIVKLRGIDAGFGRLLIMPDGQNLLHMGGFLDPYGAIYGCSTDAGSDLAFKSRLDLIAPASVDKTLNELYIVDQRRITVHDASSFACKRVISEPWNVSHILTAEGHLVAGGKDGDGNLDFTAVHTGALLSSLTVNGDAFTEFYPLRRSVDRGEVANAVEQVDIRAQPAIAGASVSGDIGIRPLAVGENVFTITVGDAFSDNAETCTLRITRRASDPPQPVVNGLQTLGFIPVEMVADPDRPVAYATAKDGKSLYRVDLLTGAVQEKRFDLPAERLTIRNGKVYVTLLRTGHQFYMEGNPDGYGAVAVVDMATFRTERIINTNVDPFDIEVDDSGYIYLSPGSNQSSHLFIYDGQTGQTLSMKVSMDHQTFIDRNPVTGKIYAVTTQSSSNRVLAIEVADGRVVTGYIWPYDGQYSLTAFQRVGPDGNVLFNGSGNVFAAKPTKDGDMVFIEKLPNPYSNTCFDSICFDLPNDRMYMAESFSTGLRAFNYATRTQRWSISMPNTVMGLQHNGRGVVALLRRNDHTYYFATYYPDAMLAGLSIDGTPVTGFKAFSKTYSITQYTDSETIDISAPALEPAGTVSGDIGTQPLQLGDNTFRIRVDGAISGETAEYTLNIKRFVANNADLAGIKASAGTLEPMFSRAVTDYTLVLATTEASTSVEPVLDDAGATLTINGASAASVNVSLAQGESKPVEIAVTARNGVTKKTYTVIVTRQAVRLTGIALDQSAVELPTGDQLRLNVVYFPADAVNKTVAWTTSNSDVAPIIEAGVIKAQSPGTAVITATAADGGHSATCTVTVMATQFASSAYTIDHQAGVMSNISIDTSIDQLKAKLENSPASVQVFDKDGNAVTGGSVATGMTARLSVAGKPTETLTLSVFGDISGDAQIDINDILYIRAEILETYAMRWHQLKAADINRDGGIDINDILYIRAHILGTYNIQAK